MSKFICLRYEVHIPAIANQIATYTYTFNASDFNHAISQVNAFDQSIDGSGGRAEIADGGLGKHTVTMNFQSASAGHGIDFVIIIYGDSIAPQNDFRIGTFLPGDKLLHK